MSRAKTSFTPGTQLPDHWFHILKIEDLGGVCALMSIVSPSDIMSPAYRKNGRHEAGYWR
jgi:hypothetical protein